MGSARPVLVSPIEAHLRKSRIAEGGASAKGSLVIEGGPHDLNWTHADRVNPELVNFLK